MNKYSNFNFKSIIFFPIVFLGIVSFGQNSCLSFMNGSYWNGVLKLVNDQMNFLSMSTLYYGSVSIEHLPFSERTSLSLFKPVTIASAFSKDMYKSGLGKDALIDHVSKAKGLQRNEPSVYVISELFWALTEGSFFDYNKDNITRNLDNAVFDVSNIQEDGSVKLPGVKRDHNRDMNDWLGTPSKQWNDLNNLYMSALNYPQVKKAFDEYNESKDRYLKFNYNNNTERNKELWNLQQAAYKNYISTLEQTRQRLLGSDLTKFESTPTPTSPERAARTVVTGTSSYDGNSLSSPYKGEWEIPPRTIDKKDVQWSPFFYKTFSQKVNFRTQKEIIKELFNNPEVFYAFYIKEFNLSSNRTLIKRADEIISLKDEQYKYAYKLLCHFFNASPSRDLSYAHLKMIGKDIVSDFIKILELNPSSSSDFDSSLNSRPNFSFNSSKAKFLGVPQ